MNIEPHILQKLANTKMPFGKYQGLLLLELPGPYLDWFYKEGFPRGELGQLLALAHEIDLNGLKPLLSPLKPSN